MMPSSKTLGEFSCVGIKVTYFFVFGAEFGVHLAELTVDPQGALAIRQVSLPAAAERTLMVVFLGYKIFSHVSR